MHTNPEIKFLGPGYETENPGFREIYWEAQIFLGRDFRNLGFGETGLGLRKARIGVGFGLGLWTNKACTRTCFFGFGGDAYDEIYEIDDTKIQLFFS